MHILGFHPIPNESETHRGRMGEAATDVLISPPRESDAQKSSTTLFPRIPCGLELQMSSMVIYSVTHIFVVVVLFPSLASLSHSSPGASWDHLQ